MIAALAARVYCVHFDDALSFICPFIVNVADVTDFTSDRTVASTFSYVGGVCPCVCVRALKEKLFELDIAVSYHVLTLTLKDQRSRLRGYKMRGSAGRYDYLGF